MSGHTTDYSHYYTFTLDEDDTGIMVRLIQSEQGNDANHLEVSTLADQ